jgi:hypothetical protein
MAGPKPRVCRCGHTKAEHCRAWGPDSIGEYGHGLCIAGWDVLHGYVFKTPTACRCTKFRRRWLRWTAQRPREARAGGAVTTELCGGARSPLDRRQRSSRRG